MYNEDGDLGTCMKEEIPVHFVRLVKCIMHALLRIVTLTLFIVTSLIQVIRVVFNFKLDLESL